MIEESWRSDRDALAPRRAGEPERLHLVSRPEPGQDADDEASARETASDSGAQAAPSPLAARLGRSPGAPVAATAAPLAARLGRSPGAPVAAASSPLAARLGRAPGGAGAGASADATAPALPATPTDRPRTQDQARPADGRRSASAPGAVARHPVPRPSSRPMVGAVFAGGIAAASALIATLASGAVPGRLPQLTMVVTPDTAQERIPVRQVTETIQLPPGVPAPSGAVVHTLPAPRPTPRTVIVTTTQSGKPVP